MSRKAIRVTLGYRGLTELTDETLYQAEKATWLDLTDNHIRDLSSLSTLSRLRGLVLDGNELNSHFSLPILPNLEILWLNNNKIDNIVIICDTLVRSTPALRELSLLKNPACPNFLNGGTPKEYSDYKWYVLSRLRNLQVLDTSPVTDLDRKEAEAKYGHMKFTRTPLLSSEAPTAATSQSEAARPTASPPNESTITTSNTASSPSAPTAESKSKESTSKGSPKKGSKKSRSKEGAEAEESKKGSSSTSNGEKDVVQLGESIKAMKPPSFDPLR